VKIQGKKGEGLAEKAKQALSLSLTLFYRRKIDSKKFDRDEVERRKEVPYETI